MLFSNDWNGAVCRVTYGDGSIAWRWDKSILKLVIAVEADIDPQDWRQVEWSLAARFRGHEDLIVLPGVKADRCDPVHENSAATKIGMIATTRPGDGAAARRARACARRTRSVLIGIVQSLLSDVESCANC